MFIYVIVSVVLNFRRCIFLSFCRIRHCRCFANDVINGPSPRCQTGRTTCCCLWCCACVSCCCVPNTVECPLFLQPQNQSPPCPRATPTAVLKGSKTITVLLSAEKYLLRQIWPCTNIVFIARLNAKMYLYIHGGKEKALFERVDVNKHWVASSNGLLQLMGRGYSALNHAYPLSQFIDTIIHQEHRS